ncbi:unnamed protein product [Ceratitis capitata]|uniref:(Mediterranean fruit fly) hypothetical protein n=1 Tax=Ceratitis capitata TaxID=7213 RepID=A0A811UIW4_CERCA|nr:unnamed protein product [Ceratitis capitata]
MDLTFRIGIRILRTELRLYSLTLTLAQKSMSTSSLISMSPTISPNMCAMCSRFLCCWHSFANVHSPQARQFSHSNGSCGDSCCCYCRVVVFAVVINVILPPCRRYHTTICTRCSLLVFVLLCCHHFSWLLLMQHFVVVLFACIYLRFDNFKSFAIVVCACECSVNVCVCICVIVSVYLLSSPAVCGYEMQIVITTRYADATTNH